MLFRTSVMTPTKILDKQREQIFFDCPKLKLKQNCKNLCLRKQLSIFKHLESGQTNRQTSLTGILLDDVAECGTNRFSRHCSTSVNRIVGDDSLRWPVYRKVSFAAAYRRARELCPDHRRGERTRPCEQITYLHILPAHLYGWYSGNSSACRNDLCDRLGRTDRPLCTLASFLP